MDRGHRFFDLDIHMPPPTTAEETRWRLNNFEDASVVQVVRENGDCCGCCGCFRGCGVGWCRPRRPRVGGRNDWHVIALACALFWLFVAMVLLALLVWSVKFEREAGSGN